MLTINKEKIPKAALMAISGFIIAFFPGVINKIFYIVGVLVIVASIVTFFMKLISGGGISSTISSILGMVIGAVIIALPSFVYTGIPLIAGIMIGFSGIDRIFRAIENGKDKQSLIIGIVFVIIAGVFIFYNANVSNTLRIIIGLALVGMGVFNLLAKDSNNSSSDSGNVIDVDDYKIS